MRQKGTPQPPQRRIVLAGACLISLSGLAGFINSRRSTPPLSTAAGSSIANKAALQEAYGRLPLSFEVNQGQTDATVRYLARGKGYSLFLTTHEAVLSLSTGSTTPRADATEVPAERIRPQSYSAAASRNQEAVLRMTILGATQTQVSGEDELPGKSNYFVGKDPRQWRKGVSNFSRVKYQEIYPGIDLVYYGNQGQLEYDFSIQPGIDPKQISLGFAGADRIRIDESGDLILDLAGKEVRQHKPYAYQENNGKREEVASRYLVVGPNEIGFELGNYDVTKELVIDPVLVYSTYFGGSGFDTAPAVAVNSLGEAYLAGTTASLNFPGSPLQKAGPDITDAFVVKLNAAGNAVLYASYFGGDNWDFALGLTVDPSGSAFVTGSTTSFNFPTAGSPFQSTKTGGNPLFKSTDAGNNFGSGVQGGTASGLTTANVSAIAVHPTNPSTVFATPFTGASVYKSTDGGATWSFSGTGIPDDFMNDIAFNRANPTIMYAAAAGTSLLGGGGGVYRSADGGSNWQPTSVTGAMNTVISDSAGIIYAGGFDGRGVWKSADGVSWSNLVIGDTQADGGADGFGFAVSNIQVDPANPAIIYVGTSGGGIWKSIDQGASYTQILNTPGYVSDHSLSIDSSNTVYAAINGVLQKGSSGGASWSVVSTPVTAGSYPTSTLVVGSTLYLGTTQNGVFKSSDGGANWSPTSLTANNIHGLVAAPSAANEIYAEVLSGSDSYVSKLSPDGSSLVYSTYLGGGLAGGQFTADETAQNIAIDSSGNAYVIGRTSAANFPLQNPTQANLGGFLDAFIAKLNPTGSSLLFSTYAGGGGNDLGRGIAVAPGGDIYVTGNTASGNFPVVNASQGTFGGGNDVFVIKFAASGPNYATAYSTFMGGPNNDQGRGIAVDSSGNAYVAGQTNSGSGISTAGAAQTTKGANVDGFLVKLNPSGAKAYGTYIGGTSSLGTGGQSLDVANGVVVDQTGNAYVTGSTRSNGFPTTNSLKTFNTTTCLGFPCNDAFVTKLNATGSSRIFSTLLGGDGEDQAFGIAMDSAGGIYVSGFTSSAETIPGAPQGVNAGGGDGFITKITPSSDLSVSMTDSPDPVSVNSSLTYTITATNSGEGSLTGINVTDTLPANLTFVLATASQGSCSGTTSLTCNLGSLNSGQSATITIQVTPTKEGTLSNTASATCNESETNSSNNSATQDTRVTVGTVYTVNSNADSDDGACTATGTGNGCTLREAINAANANAGKDTILFGIGTGLQTINLTSSLPSFNTPVSVDGTSQPGFAGQPIIELNGTSGGTCLYIPSASSGTTIRGFVINRCGGHGISIDGSNNTVQGNYIGTNASGGATASVAFSSIFINGSNNQIGGTTSADRNVISGNGHQGIAMTGSNNTIQGNYIGTNAAGTAALGGGAMFIFQGASNNMIGGMAGTTPGGSCTGACNLISGNNGSVSINTFSGAGATNNTVQGNYIGVNVTGTAALPNSGQGVLMIGVSGNHVIGNLISGNNGTGISLFYSDDTTKIPAMNNDIRGNFIGTNATGTAAIPNAGGGIEMHGGSSGNTVGGASAADRNIISGNAGDGISFGNFNGAATGNIVRGNYIGTNAAGNAILANTNQGISLFGATNNFIGGSSTGEGNLISGNNSNGINILSSSPGSGQPLAPSTGNHIEGNLIGTDITGTIALRNNSNGVAISSSNANFIGGTVAGARNVISGNTRAGISISNTGTFNPAGSNNNIIRGNYIGTKTDGNSALANGNAGISISGGSSGNIIGGDDAADGATDGVVRARNLISGNTNDGITIGNFNGPSNNTVVQGNYIGVNVSGFAAIPNNFSGVAVSGVNAAQIGGISAGAGNLISGNNQNGINLNEANPGGGQPTLPVTNTHIEGNFIGTNAAGTAALRNQQFGVTIAGANSSGNYVGGAAVGARNLIGASGFPAVQINQNANGNFVLGNWMGIDITGTTALVTNVSGTNVFGNGGGGVNISGSSNNQIGGATAAERNVIAGNNCQNVNILNFNSSGTIIQSSGNKVQGNYIGLNAAGTDMVVDPTGGPKFGGKCSGVFIAGATNNLIGGATPGAGNVIGGSAHQGVVISNNNNVIGSGNTIQGNIIGSNTAMTAALPNPIGVFLINGASNNTIGGDDAADGTVDGVVNAGNKIFGSTSDGINIQSAFLNGANALGTGNVIQGNLIGGSALLKNNNNGINLNGAMNTLIGGLTAGAGNTISFNGNNGVVLNCPTLNSVVKCAAGTVISRNSIFSQNNNLGIRFNTVGGLFGNSNQASPVISFVSVSGGGTVVQGSLTTGAPNQNYTLEFFANDSCSPSGQGEGKTYIGTYNVTTDGTGTTSFTTPSWDAVPVGKVITATATHATNGTSRFSACVVSSAATATISGRATDQNGLALSGAVVTLSGGQSATATTDSQGNYSFPNLPSSVGYTVSAALAGVTFYPASFTLANLPANRTVNFTKALTRYTITDLGALTPGPQSVGWDVNNAGQATGWSNSGATATNYRPYFYNNGTLTNLTPLGTGTNALPIAINDSVRIVGYSELTPQAAGGAFSGQIHGFFSDNGGVLKDIGTFGGTSSQAWGVNDNGVVVGQAQNASNQSRPFVWRDVNNDGLWQLSETIDVGWINNGANGRMFAINNNSVAVGNGLDGLTGFQAATLWKDDNANGISDPGELRLLGTLGGPTSFAQGINDDGYVSGVTDIAGLASNGRTMTRAFIWHDDNGNGVSDAGEMKSLGTLGGEFSSALRINASNQIVGWADAVGINTAHAMRYHNNFMLDLNAAIPQNSGWVLTEARGISDNGKITGYGTLGGINHAYLMTPSLVTQTVTFDAVADKTYGNAPFPVSATASSNLSVTFSVVSGPATVNGSTVTITGAGSVTLRATQGGDGTYDSATADRTFMVTPALLRVIADSKTKVYGAPNPAFTVHYSGFVNGDVANSLGGSLSFSTAADNSPVGPYSVTPSGLTSNNYTFQYLSATLTIDQASTSTSSGNYNLPVPGLVNLVAQVTGDAPSTLSVGQGTVTFVVRQGATTVGTVTAGQVSNGQVSASFNIPAGGAYTVYASYSGTGNYLGSTGLASLTVGNANPVPSITGVTPDSAVKKPTETGQFTLFIDGNGFMSTQNGDPANSTVDWYDRTTGQHTSLGLSSITPAQIQAVVPFTLIRDGKTVEVSVNNVGPGGGTSNVQPFFVTDTTATVTSAETVIPDPTTGTASTTSVTPSGAILSAEASSGGAGGSGTLTVAQYSEDPIGTNASPNTSAFSTAEGGGYFDVYVAPGSSFTSLTLDYCNTGGTTLYWWNGTVWALVSNQVYYPTTGCITVTVTTTSSPSIAQLTGTVFGVASGPAINSITISPSATVALSSGPITLNSSFTDACSGCGPYTAEITWGDGQTTNLGNVTGTSVTGQHTYATAGTYSIKVKVARGTSFGTSTFSPLVVFNPAAGFVTGGGWFNSPLGAFPNNPAFTGKIIFESSVKYENGTTIPGGMTKVSLPGMNFVATQFSWLSITGTKVQVGGAGTINGSGGYGFQLTGYDGKLDGKKLSDKLRVRLWKQSTGQIIYDNQSGAGGDAAAVLALGGGDITIHK